MRDTFWTNSGLQTLFAMPMKTGRVGVLQSSLHVNEQSFKHVEEEISERECAGAADREEAIERDQTRNEEHSGVQSI